MGKENATSIKNILQHFLVENIDYALETINNGYINDTYLLSDHEKPLFVLQRINRNVFKDIDGLMRNVNVTLEQLKGLDYAPIKLIKTHAGATHYEDEKGYWRLMTYIANSTAYNTTTDPEIAFEAGKIIGQFHLLLQNTKTENYIDTIPRFHDLNLREEQFKDALGTASKEKIEIAHKSILFAKEVLVTLAGLSKKLLPFRVCHNDTKLNNILFSKKENKALCLIDLDTLMKGHFYYDFGDAIRTIVNTAPEDEQEHSKITFEDNLFEAFINGLASVPPFLYKDEITDLHLGAIFMPFIHGLRALTDYLNNNVYYKVAYENQNLDRCLSLFNFTQKALNKRDYMNDLIAEKVITKDN